MNMEEDRNLARILPAAANAVGPRRATAGQADAPAERNDS